MTCNSAVLGLALPDRAILPVSLLTIKSIGKVSHLARVARASYNGGERYVYP